MSKLNIQNYGLVRERSEGTLYLMRKLTNPTGWAEEVAVKIDKKWVVQDGSKYRVLWGDVTKFTKEEESRLIEIIKAKTKEIIQLQILLSFHKKFQTREKMLFSGLQKSGDFCGFLATLCSAILLIIKNSYLNLLPRKP